MTALDETTPAPRSIAYYRCKSCGTVTSEPSQLDETALRKALDAGEVPGLRLHKGCRVVGVEVVYRTGRSIFDVLSSLGERSR